MIVGRPSESGPYVVRVTVPHGVKLMPHNTFHFHWAKSGEYVTQVTGVGPLGIEYMNARDDPRNAR